MIVYGVIIYTYLWKQFSYLLILCYYQLWIVSLENALLFEPQDSSSLRKKQPNVISYWWNFSYSQRHFKIPHKNYLFIASCCNFTKWCLYKPRLLTQDCNLSKSGGLGTRIIHSRMSWVLEQVQRQFDRAYLQIKIKKVQDQVKCRHKAIGSTPANA